MAPPANSVGETPHPPLPRKGGGTFGARADGRRHRRIGRRDPPPSPPPQGGRDIRGASRRTAPPANNLRRPRDPTCPCTGGGTALNTIGATGLPDHGSF